MAIKSIKRTTSSVPESNQDRVERQRKASPLFYYFYCELLRIFRDPWAVVFGICFPSIFFLLFGTSLYAQYASALLAQYAAYGVFVTAFQIFSNSIASERARGWTRLLRTTPLSTSLYLGVKFTVVLATSMISLFVLFSIAALTGKVHMPITAWLSLLGFMALGIIPFALAGIFLGYIGSPSTSQILGTILTLVLSFTSGFYIPLAYMPASVRIIAPYLPTYHLTQIAWYAIGNTWSRDTTPLWIHLLVLGIFALIFALLAGWAYLRDEQENFA